jgi:death-on-curing protein
MTVSFPTIDQVISLHDHVMKETGGAGGIRNRDVLEAALARVQMKQEYFPDTNPGELAALLAASLVKAHGFTDGNKRASYGALIVTLTMNGMVLSADPDETIAAIVGAASGDMTEQELETWVALHICDDPVYAGLFNYDLEGPDV